MWIPAAMAAGSALSSFFGSGDNEEANRRYQEYMAKAEQAVKSGYTQGRTDLNDYLAKGQEFTKSYRDAGDQAMKRYMGTLGMGEDKGGVVSAFRSTPGYKFALEQGLKGVGQNAAARGMAGSGAQAKELLQYGQGLADQTYGNYQQKLAGIADLGANLSSRAGEQTIETGRGLSDLDRWQAGSLTDIYSGEGKSAADSEMAGNRGWKAISEGLGMGAGMMSGGMFKSGANNNQSSGLASTVNNTNSFAGNAYSNYTNRGGDYLNPGYGRRAGNIY